MRSRIGAIIAGAVVCTAAAFFVIALSTNEWVKGDTGRFGLWNYCGPDTADKDCLHIGLTDCDVNFGGGIHFKFPRCSDFNGVRAMTILAMIFGIFAGFALLVLTAFCTMYKGRMYGLLSGMVSGIFGMAAMALFADMKEGSGDYGYSFGLLTTGWILMFGGTAYAGYASSGGETK
jgi:hypothetical protein